MNDNTNVKVYSTYGCLADDVVSSIKNNRDTTVIMYGEDAVHFIKDLIIRYPEMDIQSIQLEQGAMFSGYEDEYLIEISHEGMMFVERAKPNGKYVTFEGNVTYIDIICDDVVLDYLGCQSQIVTFNIIDSDTRAFIG